MTIRRLNRLGRRFFMSSAPIAGLLLGWTGSGALLAQPPAGQNAAPGHSAPSDAVAQRNYLNKSTIKLPIQIEDPARGSLKEVQLYIKESLTSPWVLKDTVPPTQQAFTIQLPRDGEYAFTMVTVDKQGHRFPEDLAREPARLVVVIDTQAPVIELTRLQQTPEGQLIQFDARDANLDIGRVRFMYQGGDHIFRPLDSVPGNSHVFCIPVQAVCTGLIRASAEDLAGNITNYEEHLNKMKTLEVAANTVLIAHDSGCLIGEAAQPAAGTWPTRRRSCRTSVRISGRTRTAVRVRQNRLWRIACRLKAQRMIEETRT